MTTPLRTTIRPRLPLSLPLSLGIARRGPRDPTMRIGPNSVWRASRTPDGPATIRLEDHGGEIEATAWGPGAELAIAGAPALVGLRDDITEWEPDRHPLIRNLDRRLRGMRMICTEAVLDAAVPTVLEQKVTSKEAHAAWWRMVWAWGAEAPGPARLRVPPPPETLATAPYFAFHRFGVERRRADVIRALARRAGRVEEAMTLPAAQRRGRLEAFPGVGPWTSAEIAAVAWGDADAVSVGDYHVGPCVVYAFTGRRGGDDDAMLELLEPFRPHRGRAARLIMAGAERPALRHPRAPLRDFRSL